MKMLSRLARIRLPSLFGDRRGIAAVEFALIAPALIFLIMGVFEMSFRFRASEEATRYVHEVADLVSRETELSKSKLDDIYNAATYMMKPLETTERLDLDIASIGFVGNTADPDLLWRRVAGAPVDFDLAETAGMGVEDESVVRVGIRYTYESILTTLFGGPVMAIEKEAFARPRVERLIEMDGVYDDGGSISYFGS